MSCVLLLQVVAVRQPHVAEVGDAAQLVGIDAEPKIEGAHQARGVANLARAMTGARPVGDAEVGGDADQADVDRIERAGERRPHEGRRSR